MLTFLGERAASSRKEDKAIGSLGVDYVLGAGQFRPVVGLSYTSDNGNVEVNIGFINFGT
jgi:hypothetical protein